MKMNAMWAPTRWKSDEIDEIEDLSDEAAVVA